MPYPSTTLYPQTTGLYPGDGLEVAPEVVTGDAVNPTEDSITLEGTVDPNGLTTHWYFEFGLSTAYGQQTPTRSAGTGISPVDVAWIQGGLEGATVYHYRLVGYSPAGIDYGEDDFFFTLVGINGRVLRSYIHEAQRVQ